MHGRNRAFSAPGGPPRSPDHSRPALSSDRASAIYPANTPPFKQLFISLFMSSMHGAPQNS
jgi:hypothetical protein